MFSISQQIIFPTPLYVVLCFTACADDCRYCTNSGAGLCDSCDNGFRLTSANLCEGLTFLHLHSAFYNHARHILHILLNVNAFVIVVCVQFPAE